MKKTLLRFGTILSLVAVVAVVIAFFTGWGESVDQFISILLPAGGGLSLAFPAVGVVVGTADGTATAAGLEESDLVEQDISKDITVMNPDRFPLDTITREHLRKRSKADTQKPKYLQRSTKPMADMLNPNAEGSGLAMGSPCNKFTASETNQVKKVYVSPLNINTWRTHDTLTIRNLKLNGSRNKPTIASMDTFVGDVVFFVSKKEGESLELTPISGMKGTGINENEFIVPTFTKESILYRMGQAKSELAMSTEPFSIRPEFVEQYCQNFMAQIEESTFHALTAKKADISFSDLEAENIYSMRAEIEASSTWGAKYEIIDGNDTTLFTGGIANSIDKVLEYGKGGSDRSLTKEQYTSWLKSLFVGNNGSKVRMLFAGSDVIEAIELLRESSKQISGNTAHETYLGVKCTSIVSIFGTLKVIHAPLYDEHGWKDRGLAIDLEHLTKKEFVPMKATEIDLKGGGVKNARAKVIQEVSCLLLRYPDCHGLIRPKA